MKKTSILIPCYNVNEFALNRMFYSIYQQDFDNIEVIMINDGSTDNTLIQLEKWKKKFITRGYNANVLTKSNGGIASAINLGLSYFTGDYICFLDADDILYNNYVSMMVNILEENVHMNWVRCHAEVVYENNINKCIKIIDSNKKYYGKNSFKEYLLILLDPVVWTLMIKSDYLKKCIPALHLYENNGPQEWQIVLPISYYEPCIHLPYLLYKHIKYNMSHSKKTQIDFTSYKKHMDLDNESQQIVLKSLPLNNHQLYIDMGYLGYIKTLRNQFGNETLNICEANLCVLYKKYMNIQLHEDQVSDRNGFYYYINKLTNFFINNDF